SVRIVQTPRCAWGQGCALGELRPERNVDVHAAVDRPAVPIEDRTERATPQLERGKQHRGPGDEEERAEDRERHLPPRKVHEPGGDTCDRAADGAKREADGGEDAGKLGNVEGRAGRSRCGWRSGGTGDPRGEAVVGRLFLGRGKLRHLLLDETGHLFV